MLTHEERQRGPSGKPSEGQQERLLELSALGPLMQLLGKWGKEKYIPGGNHWNWQWTHNSFVRQICPEVEESSWDIIGGTH